MSQPTEAADHGQGQAGSEDFAEPDKPNNLLIFVLVTVVVGLTFFVVIAIIQMFTSRMRDEIEKKQLSQDSTQLRNLRAEESSKLSRYQWVNQKGGVVRIPVARAKELVLAEYTAASAEAKANPPPVPAPMPPEPTPAPAPEGSAAMPSDSAVPAGSGSAAPAPSGSAVPAPSGSAKKPIEKPKDEKKPG